MFDKKFGMLPKKTVTFDGNVLKINKTEVHKDDIKFVVFKPFDFLSNKWGNVYISLNGEEFDNTVVFPKNTFDFTKGQTKYVEELLTLMDVDVVRKSHAKVQTTDAIVRNSNIKKCPFCDSANIHFIGNNKKSFSVGKAVGGAALTGGIGALAGFAGKKGKTDNWHCANCGGTFELKK